MTATVHAGVRLEFDAEDHRYELVSADGTRRVLPSVTTILRTVGLVDFGMVNRDVLERARARGERVHRALHYYAEGTLDWSSVSDIDRPYVEAGAFFLSASLFKPLGMEHRLWSPTYGYAGTTDLYGWWDGQPAVADYKSGDWRDARADLQLAAYAAALREQPPVEWIDVTPTTPIVRISVEVKRTGKVSTMVHRDPCDFARFQAALAVFRERDRYRRMAPKE